MLALLASPVAAQLVRGAVRDSASGAPIPGAVVTILDSAGATSARTIADADGRFVLRPAGGAVRLRVLKIGYRPADARIPAHEVGSDVTVPVAMLRLASVLGSVRVTGQKLCPGGGEASDAFALWEQARAGLLAAIVARESKPAAARISTFDRSLTRPEDRVIRQVVHSREGTTTRPFSAAAPPGLFAVVGYMMEDRGERTYNAPDADVLLDPTFAATHCLHITHDDRGHAGQVGLAFEPVPGRDTLVEVTGALWMDRDVPALRTLEFRYVGLEPAAVDAGTGGTVSFRTMANGVVFIDRWVLRLAVLETNPYAPRVLTRNAVELPPLRRAQRRDLRAVQMSETGGTVDRAAWPDGPRWDPTPARITGRVVQRGSTMGAPHVLVAIEGTADSTLTDSTGAFSFDGMVPGRYQLGAHDTTLSAFVADRYASRVTDVPRGGTAEVRFEVRATSDVLRDVCRGEKMPDSSTVIVGRVTDPDDHGLQGVTVRAKWLAQVNKGQKFDAPFGKPSGGLPFNIDRGEQVSDVGKGGAFKVCGVARDRPVKLSVERAKVVVADTVVYVGDVAVREFTWRVVPRADGAVPPSPVVAERPVAALVPEPVAAQPSSGTLTGKVVRDSAGTPVEGAQVAIESLARTVATANDGTFRLAGVPAGRQVVIARRPGFAAQVDTVTIIAGQTVDRRYVLGQRATPLDTARTTAAAAPRYISPALRGFEDRRKQGFGRFISDSALRKMENRSLGDVVAQLPGLKIVRSKGTFAVNTRNDKGSDFVFGRIWQKKVGTKPMACYATVYLDGVLLWDLHIATSNSTDSTGIDMSPPPNLDDFVVSNLAGIEYYPGEATAPPGFRQSGCGLLMLWTREK